MLYLADELFFTGTAAEITPIRSVDRLHRRQRPRGPVTEALQKAFFGLFTGETPDKYGWLEPVDMSRRRAATAAVSAETMAAPKTLFQKVWERHEVVPETADTPAVLYHRPAPDP